jgi:transcriptional regulator with XRE-family HTH domain
LAFSDVGKALAILRRRRGLSQTELAARCSIGRTQVFRYESGRELMRLHTLEKLLNQLGVEPEEFFRFLATLDPATLPPPGPAVLDERRLRQAFDSLRSALNELQRTIERALGGQGGRRYAASAAGSSPGSSSPASAAGSEGEAAADGAAGRGGGG